MFCNKKVIWGQYVYHSLKKNYVLISISYTLTIPSKIQMRKGHIYYAFTHTIMCPFLKFQSPYCFAYIK